VLVGIGAGVYYAFAIVWPSQVAVVYASGNLIEGSYFEDAEAEIWNG
jgi:hypothetical protein